MAREQPIIFISTERHESEEKMCRGNETVAVFGLAGNDNQKLTVTGNNFTQMGEPSQAGTA
jgi:hypothetical protein